MPFLILFEQIKHIVRREAKVYMRAAKNVQDAYKAWAYPRAMMALQHVIMFCMMYPLPTHFEVLHRLGRAAVVRNTSMDVLRVVRQVLSDVAQLPHCRSMRPGFYAGADEYKRSYPGMKQYMAKKDTKLNPKTQPNNNRQARRAAAARAAGAPRGGGRGGYMTNNQGRAPQGGAPLARGQRGAMRGAFGPRNRGARQ